VHCGRADQHIRTARDGQRPDPPRQLSGDEDQNPDTGQLPGGRNAMLMSLVGAKNREY
jgi:hypothetical protein